LPQSAGPGRISLEITNNQALVAIRLGQRDKYIASIQEGLRGAKAIGSKKRENEIIKNQRDAKEQWKYEQDVLKLDELFDSDENEVV